MAEKSNVKELILEDIEFFKNGIVYKKIYELKYDGYESQWNFFVLHSKEYSDEEFQEFIDNILSNYKLLIALELLDKTRKGDFDFDKEFNETIKECGNDIYNKTFMFENYASQVLEVLTDFYEFEEYFVDVKAQAYYTEYPV